MPKITRGLDVAPKGATAGNYCTKGTLAADGKCGKGSMVSVVSLDTN